MKNWKTFIESAPSADHAVQIYDELDELAHSVGSFLDAGFRAGAPAVVIVTADHWQHVAAELEARGWDAAALEADRLLTRVDAEQTLAAFMDRELPSKALFERVVGGLVDEVAERRPGHTIRAFGEMVDVLLRRGRQRAAIALEELWNDLAENRAFALLCGYHLDVFDREVQKGVLPEIFRAHSHAEPVSQPSQLAAALDQALAEIVGPLEAARIYLDVAESVPRDALPRAQAVLSWLSTGEAALADKILERVRWHYVRLRSASTARIAAGPSVAA